MREKIAFTSLFLVSFALYLFGAAASVTTGDSGEFMAAAMNLSIPHAPSYPLYTVLSRAFIDVIPWGSQPYQINLFSAFCSAMTLVVIGLTLRQLGLQLLESILISLFLGTTTSFWMNSLVTEVFPLHALFVALLVYGLVKFIKEEDQKKGSLIMIVSMFVLGLGLGNHHTLVFAFPCFLYALWRKGWLVDSYRHIVFFFIFGLIGFSIYMFLPFRSAQEPPLNWGKPTNPDRLVRTILRKDYGSFSLALGESPKRTFSNSVEQLKRFSNQLKIEIVLPTFGLIALGFVLGWRRDPIVYESFLILFLLSGPFFYLLGNLPFNAQSEGIMGRFFIMPTMALVLGLGGIFQFGRRAFQIMLGLLVLVSFSMNQAEATAHRSTRLVLDYGRAMLSSVPPGAALFLDGGDDAFYSLAMLHHGLGRRPDLMIHDRGGLIFKNIYGDDFRRIGKKRKKERRWQVEREVMRERPIYYSTMDPQVLPGIPIRQEGFLVHAAPKNEPQMTWPLICLRSLYPLEVPNYRTRALGCFFPFMYGLLAMEAGFPKEGLLFFRRATAMGKGVDWLKSNLGYLYARMGYEAISEKNFGYAEKIYRQWAEFNPDEPQAMSNLGVVYERQKKWDDARIQYELAMKTSDTAVDPVYNLAVWYWRKKDWKNVVFYLEETLRRKPDHQQAQGYLARAKQYLNE